MACNIHRFEISAKTSFTHCPEYAESYVNVLLYAQFIDP